VLLRILSRVKDGTPLKQAYLLPVEDMQERAENERDIIQTRIRLRKYLRELDHYQQKLQLKS